MLILLCTNSLILISAVEDIYHEAGLLAVYLLRNLVNIVQKSKVWTVWEENIF